MKRARWYAWAAKSVPGGPSHARSAATRPAAAAATTASRWRASMGAIYARGVSFRIRQADPSDAEQLARLADAVSSEPEGWLISIAGEWRSPSDERRYLKALRRYAHAAVFVAERDDGVIVGR